MRKMISILMILLLVSSVPAVADELFVPHVSSLRVNKFELQLVGNLYWIVQKGEWDWDAYPLTLCCTYEDGSSDSMALDPSSSGRAWVLGDKSKLEKLASEKGENMRWAVTHKDNGEDIELEVDYPLTASTWNSIALMYHIWYADGALWYTGGNEVSTPPTALTKTFSDGRVETVALPALDGNEAYMILTPSEIELDLQDSHIGWITYSLE